MTLVMGWCLDGHHDECRYQYMDWNDKFRECACECHKKGSGDA